MEPSLHRSPAEPDLLAPAAPAGWRARTFASLENRNFRLFYIGQGISLTGTWMADAAEKWLTYKLTNSNRWLGFVGMVSMLPLVFAPLAGVYVDRVRKRPLLACTAILNFTVSFIYATLVFKNVIRPWQVALLASLGGCVLAVEMPGRQSFLIEMVGKGSLLNAISLNSALFNVTRAVGPAVAGIVMARWGMGWCFLADAVSFLAVLVALLLMSFPGTVAPRQGKSVLRELLEGFRYMARHRLIRVLLALLAVSMLTGQAYLSQMPAFARDDLHVREGMYGTLLGMNGLGAMFGAVWLAGLGASYDRGKLVFRMQWVFGAMLVALSLTRSLPLAGLFLALTGFGMVTFFSTANALIQTDVPDELRGRVLGVWALVFGLTLPLGQLIMGAVAQRFGVPFAMEAGGAVCLAFSVVLYLLRPRSA